ncbi:hypothetical protein V6N13_117532 [Hibiscus sabdariffa]|uniref:Uncharacterized protein n=1 Tax=Hibiscus sabdariffa TaxID=183260 RepID=A0ABR2PAV5_9ROSI
MAHFNKTKILVIAFILVCNAPSFGARKVLSEEKMNSPVLERSIVASADPKAFGSAARIGLSMARNGNAWPEQSVPSPGSGN